MEKQSKEEKHGFVYNKTKAFILITILSLLAVAAVLLVMSFFITQENFENIVRFVLIAFLICLSVLLFNIHSFFSSLEIIDHKAELISQGNLNVSDISLEKSRGLETLTLALNDIKYNFLSFIELTKGNIVTLSDAVEQVTNSIDMNYTGNQQIAASMSMVAEKAGQQLNLVKDTIAGVENSNDRIKKITDSIKIIEEYIEGTVTTTEAGTKNLEHFYAKLNTMSDNLDSTNKSMQELNGEIGKISSIGEFIIQVSEQLKLLSLNASIEAARAGDAGKGFAVVSNEIRNLSTKTQESMKQIEAILSEVMKSSDNVNSSIGGFISSFNESKEIFGVVKESFHSINQQSGIINNDMKGIYKEINRIGEFTAETKEKGMGLQTASDEISSGTQDVAAVTQQVLAGLEGITSQSYALNNMLSNIQSLVKRFNTSVLPVDKTSRKQLKLACLSISNNEFWEAIHRGVTYAQKELAQKNTIVDFFGFDPPKEVSLEDAIVNKVRECIESGYDGISLPGFFSKAIPVVEQAHKKGIPVMAFNCDFAEQTSRLAVFGPNNIEGGKLAGSLIAQAIENNGNILIVRGSSEAAESRKKGILEAIRKHSKVRIADELIINDNADTVYATVKEYLKSARDIQGICIAGGGVEGAAKALEETGSSKKIKLVGFEHTKEIFQYIKNGIIYASVGQDTFGQGHDPMIWLYNCIITGEKTPDEIMYLRSDVVDSRNVNDLIKI